jgi:predicted TIM-barrel fold metal-dependent hydrolase
MVIEPGCDGHAHVFGAKYPFDSRPAYIPHPTQRGTASQFRAVIESHGLSHGLLVQAQPYGRDNRCMIDALAGSGGRFKGIALVAPEISNRELERFGEIGVIGIRINLSTYGMRELTEPGANRLLERVKERGWFVQVHCEKDEIVEAAPILRRSGVKLMIDHFGRPDIARGTNLPGFQTVLEFGRSHDAVVKLSGPFRSSLQGWPFLDVDPFVAAAIEAYTLERCVWGSDWPFVHMDERVDYGPGFACLSRWLPDRAQRRQVLWDTPARLFGFA